LTKQPEFDVQLDWLVLLVMLQVPEAAHVLRGDLPETLHVPLKPSHQLSQFDPDGVVAQLELSNCIHDAL
jgi:hypothetical protein